METKDQAYQNLLTAMKEQADADKLFLKRGCDSLENLNLYNSLYAEMLVELAEDLTHFTLNNAEETAADMEIDEEYGKGINLYCVIRALSDYEESDDVRYLTAALIIIMREKERLALC